jgi:two-component sensor histidine kinase
VQAIALQTLRYTANPADFADNFSGRLQSLAEAHSLLSNATWRGADLGDLIDGQLRLGTADAGRISAVGPQVHLAPQGALHLALVLHELGTNARKYGALAGAEGTIALTWTLDDGYLHVNWREQGGPPVKVSTRRGFGTTLIEESVKAEGGSAHVSYRVEGVLWEFRLRLAEVSLDDMNASGFAAAATALADPAAGLRVVEQPAGSLAGRRLLVIEDEPLVAMTIAAALEDAGAAHVETVSTVDDALAAIEQSDFAVAVLDGNLNGAPVGSVAAALTRKQVPFLFVSGYGRDGLPPGFAQAPVLSKPFRPDQLVDGIANILAVAPLKPVARHAV